MKRASHTVVSFDAPSDRHPGRGLWHLSDEPENVRSTPSLSERGIGLKPGHEEKRSISVGNVRRGYWLGVSCAIAVGAIVLLGAVTASRAAEKNEPDRIKKPAVAGMFYPSDPDKLKRVVAESLEKAGKEKLSKPVRAVLAPHAGYKYCQEPMAAAYKQISGPTFGFDTVILVGPSHRMPTKAGAVSSAQVWETPLGRVTVDVHMCRELVEQSDRIEFDDRPHAIEHSLEVQLPYLMAASAGKAFKVVPVLINSSDPLDQMILARALVKISAKRKALIVVSTDLSHYPTATVAEKVDVEILRAVASLDAGTVEKENRRLMSAGYRGLSCTMCGLEAVLTLERAAKDLGITGAKVLSYRNSAKASGDRSRVVGYGAVAFTGDGKAVTPKEPTPMKLKLSRESKKELIALAREAAKTAVRGGWNPFDPIENPELQVKAGCFVTFKNAGRLRGCIGQFTSEEPLWKTVQEVAIASATKDSRFFANPIETEEFPRLDVEVSVLSPMQLVSDPLKDIKLGEHGIVIRDQGRGGTFLPQVATETGWSLEEFLGHCARDKAGLGWTGWQSPTAKVYSYTATIIHEEK
ncbi:AmmeMemoRadiSam system protein B [Thermodesulfobacteriota bacterium]